MVFCMLYGSISNTVAMLCTDCITFHLLLQWFKKDTSKQNADRIENNLLLNHRNSCIPNNRYQQRKNKSRSFDFKQSVRTG